MVRIKEIAHKARLTPYLASDGDVAAYYLALTVAREAERILVSRWWLPEDPIKGYFAESVDQAITDFMKTTGRERVPYDLLNHLALLIQLCRE